MSKTINEEIQQQKFRNHHQLIQLNILFTAGWIQNKHLQILKQYGLSHQQYNVLRILKGTYPQTLNLGQIKAKMLDRMSDTSRVVNRLFTIGLLSRTTDSKDRRVAKIKISDKGLKLLKEMEKEETHLDSITNQITREEAMELSQLLDKLRNKDNS
ncbi:MAG: MarR family transcriptional regulator [Bacteroidetes bacterium]|nr:MarR family transcriptional regulator [Bacteroidota bacterium]